MEFRQIPLIFRMPRYLFYAVLAISLISGLLYLATAKEKYASDHDTLSHGKTLFTKYCMSCHSLESEGVGPPLGGVTKLLSKNALSDFISDPEEAITSGNERAIVLQARYRQTMPPFDWLQEKDINAILAYIHHESEKHQLDPFQISTDSVSTGLTGRLAPPVKKSKIKIELEEVVQIPKMKDTSPDLGIVTLRAHPSGDGTFFVSDQNGIIYKVSGNKAEIFLDIRQHIKDFQSGPGIATGIGSFEFHPDFLNNGLIYITHAETYKGQIADYQISDSITSEVQWIIGEWKMDNVHHKIFSGTHREMLRLHAPTFAHGCQDIGFVPDIDKDHPEYGLLYIGFGDGGSNNIRRPEMGHHLKSFLGSIMRIDPVGNNSRNGKYGIPPDNPFANEKDPLTVKEIYAYGFRNPHRLTWDKENGNRLMATDIGEANIEELNTIEKGGDYGWPAREGTYGIATLKDMKTVFMLHKSDDDLYKKPYVQYDHTEGQAISGGFIYDGNLAPLRNKFICGDIVTGELFYVNIDAALSDSSVYELTIVENGKETTLKQMSNSNRLHLRVNYDPYNKQLYIITKCDGRIRRVTKAY